MSAKNPENIIVADDILGRLFTEKRTKRQTMRALDLLVSLRPGDYVVHIDHGVGIFREMIEKEVSGISREYIQIEYAKSDRLYVPITELYRITKYLADDAPVLHTLGGKEWKKVMSGTEADILRTAQELLELSAQRKLESGFSFTKNPPEEERFKKAFAHEHTRDQSRTIEEVFLDMESSEPMDRLVAGDVGFGKTEVAMNAAYKAHISGKQVAVISPLVVLTLEHAESFEARFRDFGVKIRVLSRLQSDTEAREVIR